MSTVNGITYQADKYLVDIPTSVMQPYSIDFDSVYNGTVDEVAIESGDEDLDAIFEAAAKEYNINVNLLKAVAKIESDFDRYSVSGSGAMGIMQLMPYNCESLGIDDPFDPRQNIFGGACMIGYLLYDYNFDVTLALAAYNAGSGAVNRAGGVPDGEQVQRYVRKVNAALNGALDNDSWTIEGAAMTPVYGEGYVEPEADSLTQEYNSIFALSGIGASSMLPQALVYDTEVLDDSLYTRARELSDKTVNILDNEKYQELL